MTAGIYPATVAEIVMVIVMVIAMAIAMAIGIDLSPYACASGLEALVGLARWVFSL